MEKQSIASSINALLTFALIVFFLSECGGLLSTDFYILYFLIPAVFFIYMLLNVTKINNLIINFLKKLEE